MALQLRTLQTMAEIATEKNSTIIFPAQFMTTTATQQAGRMSAKRRAIRRAFVCRCFVAIARASADDRRALR